MTTATEPQLRTFADAERRLAETLPGYESRTEQQAMARRVEQALGTGVSALIEAGCGTGKSLGSMIPAILWATGTGSRIVVSTATIALMEQYANKDVPFLEENLGVPFRWALLKGRSNYLCMAKATSAKPLEVPFLKSVLTEVEDAGEHSGDREHFTTEMTRGDWSKISASSEECVGKANCPFGKVCFAEKAKAKAKEAHVVITNHAMLFTDLKVREATDGDRSMLGEYDAVIVDEAHETEEIATNAMSDTLRESGIRKLVSEAMNYAGEQSTSVTEATDEVLAALANVWALLPEKVGTTMTLRFFLEHEDPFMRLISSLRELANDVSEIAVINDGERGEARRVLLASRASGYADRVMEVMLADDDDLVRWIEEDDKGNRVFKSAPLEVGPWLDAWLWQRVTAILVSATLSVGGSFNYIQRRIGLADASTLNVGTPFDMEHQSMLYVPASTMPSPKDRQAWKQLFAIQAMELIRASKGGCLLLFTSRDSMQSAYESFADSIEAMGYTVLMQGQDTNKTLARKFTEDKDSVLFALKSFFTGVDFAGDTCRLVIVDKLPFPVPTDVMFAARAAKCDREARRAVSFREMSIPAMTLTLLQGFGRLIRSKSDRGVVAILDSRLSSTGYGKSIVGNLPDCPATTNLQAVRDFFATA